ncbi:MAG: peptide chain release factor 1 [Roseovarius sp.]|uniref:peptide chain release factor 1 n=1 Tax=Roseovarius sp. TaxID=1486281 RepID=UPI0032EAE1AC
MVPLDKLNEITQRFEYLEARMAEGGGDIARLGREYAELRPVVEEIRAYRQLLDDLEGAQAMLDDPEMRELAREELETLEAHKPGLEDKLQLALLPKDEADNRSVILEIRPGTGGEEAALFAGDLLRMYQRHAEEKGWTFEIIEMSQTELGGIKELVAHVKGDGVFARMKFESGVHRVQRVPETESGGRIHTSAATVAVLPEAEDVDIEIDPNALRIDTMRASGAGGQHVNTTDSAVRITHVPTGIVVQCQQERSQHKNRAKAWDMLRARLYEAELKKREEAANEEAASKTEIGWGHQIRSYVLQPYQLVKDLRTGTESTNPQEVLDGKLDPFMEAALAQRVYGGGEEVEDID